MEDLYQIYLVTNLINDKKYVGQSIKNHSRNYLTRWKEHIPTESQKHLDRLACAIKHYGVENFDVMLIEDDIPEFKIDELEMYYIEYYNTFYKNNCGYNMTLGGQGIHGYTHTEETLKKISESSKIKWDDWKAHPEILEARNLKISNKLKGKVFSESHKRKLAEIAHTRTGEKNSFYGKHHTEESKAKMRLNRGFPVNMCDKNTGEVIFTFDSVTDAARYLIEQGITTNKTCFTRIFEVLYKKKGQGKTAYGFKWEFVK